MKAVENFKKDVVEYKGLFQEGIDHLRKVGVVLKFNELIRKSYLNKIKKSATIPIKSERFEKPNENLVAVRAEILHETDGQFSTIKAL